MKFTRVFAFMALAGLAGSAFATNGMFSHGYGMKSKGMAGASTASSDDAFFGANNPAAAAFAGNRLDLGVDLFSPIRETVNVGGNAPPAGFGPGAVGAESEAEYFLIPEFGYNYMVSDTLALGVTVYGQGGMNTDYPALGGAFGTTNSLGGQGALGVDLMQLIIAPTAAFKVAPNHSIGVSPLLGYQKFAATGLQGFAPISSDGTALTNQGNDDAFGYGLRIGYMGKFGAVSIGAAYSTKVDFDEFSKYKGLFAEQGDLDLPENYNLGIAWQATPELKLAADYQRINYSGVNSIGNASDSYATGGILGLDNGSGFGWADMDVWKLGAEYKLNQQMTLRAGYSYGESPIDGDAPAEATFNIIAPGVIEHHITLGMTYTTASGDEMTVAYMHGFENDVSGNRPAGFGGGVDTTTMYQNSLGFQYSWKM
ncbi:OmpP1/FadL family transporter [Thiobacillus sp.]|uniref:OmpP1/FadL family transporter n=1 Tax=Thiobacillus sp. TaxID=924 RepID=UPI0025F96F42|nr:outer membrane protein transport protein [Thiobacillus sp.]MBT9539605.1 outer membrane protein transport protein [Thiobacillus sp.]